MYQRADGIVDFDKSICIGCKACIAACPYDAIFINPEDHSAEKCNFCAHRLDVGLEPACVVVCPTEAILVGDLERPDLEGRADRGPRAGRGAPPGEGNAAEALLQGRAPGDARSARRAPARRRPLHVERAGPRPSHQVTSGHPGARATARRPRSSPTTCRTRARGIGGVSLYTWTKGIAAGAYLVPLAARAARLARRPRARSGAARRRSSPAVFLALTGVLLDRRPRAPGALLPDLHAAAVAELARARRVHHRRLRVVLLLHFVASFMAAARRAARAR